MTPALAWLSKNKARSTYTAGLQASALTMLPKIAEEKTGDDRQLALESCKSYLIETMGRDGGYTYVSPHLFNYKTMVARTAGELWEEYYTAIKKGDPRQQATLKEEIDKYMKAVSTQAGGPLSGVQSLATELRLRRKAASKPAEIAHLDGQLKELDSYSRKMPAPTPAVDKTAEAVKAKKRYEELVAGRKTLQTPEKKTVTSEELEKLIGDAKERWEILDKTAKSNFTPTGDLSNAQYGALGAWALVDYGMEMPSVYWARTERFWRMMQNPDGGWPYDAFRRENGGVTTDSMGVAGIASIFVCQEFLDTELRLLPKPDKNIDAGLAWLNKAYKPEATNMYYMYSVERVGLSSGLKFFGTTDWYKQGAAGVIGHQAANGSWQNNVDTSYALLFLARGRNPVVFNKLQHNGPWNARPRDSAYVTRWMSKRLEKPINWQVVNLQVSPEEWLDAPILLITGSQDPKFSKEDVAKLRAFVHAGGMIFSTTDGAAAAFSDAMRKVAAEVVEKRYEMRPLPRNHDLFSKDMGVDLPNPPTLMGMSNGVREVWIHSPQDIGAEWQMRRVATNKASFELGTALYYYASGMGSLRRKLQPLEVKGGEVSRRTTAVARVEYSGNADPEPGAWARLAKIARRDFKTTVNVSTVKIPLLDAKVTPLAHLTGSNRVTFTEDDVKGLRNYADRGGLLFIDAAGGNAEFAGSCQELFSKMYPEAKLELLPAEHAIISGSIADGAKIGDVEFRKYGVMKLKRRVTTPELEAITVDGKIRILFSRWDICSGFLGTNTWGITGFAPSTAERLGRNILLYSAGPAEAASDAKTGVAP
jgi:hypothetical protein